MVAQSAYVIIVAMRTLLKLQHHKHTAKPLPHHHTSYRGLVVVLLVVGLSLLFIQKVAADEYKVTAKISAEIPSSPAVITNPQNNQVFETRSIAVSGTCPVTEPQSIVSLWRGGTMLGSSICQANGTFSISIFINRGNNAITPKIINITDDSGPDGPTLNIMYQPPKTLSPGDTNDGAPGNNNSSGVNYPALRLLADKTFFVFKPNKPSELTIYIEGGRPPYQLKVEWGDGETSNLVYDQPGKKKLLHIYVGSILAGYEAGLTLTDTSNQSARMNLVAITYVDGGVPLTIGSVDLPGAGSVPLTMWTLYGAAVFAALGFWGGEFYQSRRLVGAVLPKNHKGQ